MPELFSVYANPATVFFDEAGFDFVMQEISISRRIRTPGGVWAGS
jgi:hypothetical protein